MISKLCKIGNYASRWIAILNGFILVGTGLALVAMGDHPAYLLFTALGIFALYVGIWRPEIWSTGSATNEIER